jgi:hypothetical protein
MNTLFKAMNKTASTDNGALAHHSSLSANLDFFYLAGASRGKDIKQEFKAALNENPDVALRTLQWLRDIRGGAGERQLFRDLIPLVGDVTKTVELLSKLPELGRYDDLLAISESFSGGVLENHVSHTALNLFAGALRANNGLSFKWTPIKGATAKKLRTMLGFKKEADWRKFVVAGRKTVEQQMCAKEWSEINFSHVPSVASARYQKAFGRNASKEYGEYLASLKKGEVGVKINASAVYPIDVFKSCYNGNPEVAEQQWKALPNYLEGNSERILPLIDVSGSMGVSAGGNGSVSCMDVAISLGWYIADKIEGKFKNTFMTFEDVPRMLQLTNLSTLKDTFDTISSVSWGRSTNIQNAFKVLLNAAVQNEVPKEDMPTTIMILSDMQFDCSYVDGRSVTAFDMVKAEYAAAGYEIPKIVFWNLNASNKTIPVTKDETGTAMVSGYSPSLMKGILKGGMTPEQIMLDTVMIDRYKL